MVSPKRVFFAVCAITACIGGADAFSGPRDAGTYFLTAAKSIFKRAPLPALQFPEPTALPDPLDGAKSMKLVDIDRSLAKDRKIKNCQDGELGYDYWGPTYDSHHHEICSYPFDRSSASEAVDRNAIIQRLNDNREKHVAVNGTYNIRSNIEPGTVEFVKGWPESTTEWSNNPGTRGINHMDACQLCTSIDDNYIIPRGYINNKGEHQCVCKKWAKQGEKFMVCNCNLCDAFLIPQGLRDKCMDMMTKNIRSEYISRYVALNNHNVFVRLYNDWKGLGKARDFAIADVQKELSVCRSGVQGKEIENRDHQLFGEVKKPGKVCPQLLENALRASG